MKSRTDSEMSKPERDFFPCWSWKKKKSAIQWIVNLGEFNGEVAREQCLAMERKINSPQEKITLKFPLK